MEQQGILRKIPKVDELLGHPALSALDLPAGSVRDAVRRELEALRSQVLSGALESLPDHDAIAAAAGERARREALPSLRPVINGTGVVLHTNLGRACLSRRAAEAVAAVAGGYSTLEYDVERGCRGSRHSHIEDLLALVTGAEAAMVVNNNAAAVLLILSAIGRGGEVAASRGEMVEIGGSFRIPEIMTQCGCALREVGTTNKTHLYDYENAIGPETKALLRVHTSNYRIVGFSERPPLAELVELGRRHGLPVIEDLGSGSLADLILGKKRYIDQLKKHPLARAVRVDKMTIAALRETLYAYMDPARAREEIPALSMLGESLPMLHSRAALLCQRLADQGCAAQVVEAESQVGGGSCPAQTLPSWAVAVEPGRLTVDGLEEALRRREKPVIGRISQGRYLLDVRTLRDEELPDVEAAVKEALQ